MQWLFKIFFFNLDKLFLSLEIPKQFLLCGICQVQLITYTVSLSVYIYNQASLKNNRKTETIPSR